jgi:hypothetical protein
VASRPCAIGLARECSLARQEETNTMELRPAAARGLANFGWLHSQHSFSFGSYYDPQHMGFSDLLVINEDRVRPGRGFDTHGHRDMEIFSYVLDGALEHKDSMGTGSVIRPGDVQMMSAGTGVRHSEMNHGTEVAHLLQIWMLPSQAGLAPSYDQHTVDDAELRGRLRLVGAPVGSAEAAQAAVALNADVRLHIGRFDGPAERAGLTLDPARKAYVHLARGRLTVSGHALNAGDALAIDGETALSLHDGQDAEVLVFELQP